MTSILVLKFFLRIFPWNLLQINFLKKMDNNCTSFLNDPRFPREFHSDFIINNFIHKNYSRYSSQSSSLPCACTIHIIWISNWGIFALMKKKVPPIAHNGFILQTKSSLKPPSIHHCFIKQQNWNVLQLKLKYH